MHTSTTRHPKWVSRGTHTQARHQQKQRVLLGSCTALRREQLCCSCCTQMSERDRTAKRTERCRKGCRAMATPPGPPVCRTPPAAQARGGAARRLPIRARREAGKGVVLDRRCHLHRHRCDCVGRSAHSTARSDKAGRAGLCWLARTFSRGPRASADDRSARREMPLMASCSAAPPPPLRVARRLQSSNSKVRASAGRA